MVSSKIRGIKLPDISSELSEIEEGVNATNVIPLAFANVSAKLPGTPYISAKLEPNPNPNAPVIAVTLGGIKILVKLVFQNAPKLIVVNEFGKVMLVRLDVP